MPIREDYSSTKSFNNAWGYFAELLSVVKENNHPEFEKYYDITVNNGMNEAVFERKIKELFEIKKCLWKYKNLIQNLKFMQSTCIPRR